MRLGWRTCFLLSLALSLAGCRTSQPGGVRVDPALALMAPADTLVLAGFRMDKIRETEVYKNLLAERSIARLDAFAREAGFHPITGVWEVLAAFTGKYPLLLARGKFSPTGGLEPRLREGAPRRMYKGYTLIGDERASVAFLNSSTAAAGPAAAVESVIDGRGSSAGIPAAILEKMKTLPADSHAWAVSIAGLDGVPLPVPSSGNFGNLARLFRGVNGGTAWANLGAGLRAEISMTAAEAQSARQVHDALRGLIGIGRLSTPDNQRELLRFFDAIQVSQEASAVRVRADLPLDLLLEFEQFLRGNPGLPRLR